MKLSAELLDWILQGLGGPGAGDKRRAPRTALRARVIVFPCGDQDVGEPHPVQLRDISRGGMRIESSRAVPAGSRLILQLPRMGDRAVLILCAAVHDEPCRDDSDLHSIGLRFERILDGPGVGAGGLDAVIAPSSPRISAMPHPA